MMWLWIGAAMAALWWLGQGICVMRTLWTVRPIASGRIDGAGVDGPLVSVICPARDEEDAIEEAARIRLSDPAPWMEFIFVNDRSGDATGDILERVCAGDTRARVIHNTELPDGWLGKVYAQQVGIDHARTPMHGWYLFSDGDTRVHPGAVEAAITHAINAQADHVALTPKITKGTWMLKLCITPLMRVLICMLRLWLANDDRQPRAMGVGAFNLVRREAFERAGGLESLRLEVADDVGVGRIVKDAGGRSRTAIGAPWVDIVWYRTAAQFLQGTEKGVAKASTRLGSNGSGLLAVIVVCIDLLPWLLLFWLPSAPGLLASATAAMAVLVSVNVARAFGLPVFWALLVPLGAIMTLLITWRAVILGLIRGGVRWRGDTHHLRSTTAGERVRF